MDRPRWVIVFELLPSSPAPIRSQVNHVLKYAGHHKLKTILDSDAVTLAEEAARLRAENAELRQRIERGHQIVRELQAEIARLKSESPSAGATAFSQSPAESCPAH